MDSAPATERAEGDTMTAVVLGASGFLTSRSSLGADLSLLLSARGDRPAHRRRRAGAPPALRRAPLGADVGGRPQRDPGRRLDGVSLVRFILPGVPGNLSKHGHTLAAVHAAVGIVAAALGIFLVMRANQLTRRGESVARYKTTMRAAYIVYLAAFALGLWLYVVTYG